MRYSKQRELIRNQVQPRSDHPTANAIYAALREVCPGLSLGTVYRNLNCLVDAGSIRRVEVPGHADHFDPPRPPPWHRFCRGGGAGAGVAVGPAARGQLFCMAQNAEPAQFE